MSTQPTRVPDDDEVPEADRVEQEQSAGVPEDRVVPPADASDHAVPEASEGDLAEQSREVPLDDEER